MAAAAGGDGARGGGRLGVGGVQFVQGPGPVRLGEGGDALQLVVGQCAQQAGVRVGVGVGLGFGGSGGAQAPVDAPGEDRAGDVHPRQGAFVVGGGEDAFGGEAGLLRAPECARDGGERVVGDQWSGGAAECLAGGCGVAQAGGLCGGVGVLGRQLADAPGAFLLGADALAGGGREAAVGGDAVQGLVESLVVLEGDVEVVSGASAGGGDVGGLAGGAGGEQGVGAGDGHALGAVDGGGVAEFAVLFQVVGGQGEAAAVLGVADDGVAGGGVALDRPHVAVLDEVFPAAAGQPALVAAGDDQVADVRAVAVAQPHRARAPA